MVQDKIIRKLRKLIERQKASGKLRFPAERKLAEDLKVSRLTIGKAISILVCEKLLIRKPGSGTFIVDGDQQSKKIDMCLAVLFKSVSGPSSPHFIKIQESLAKHLDGKNISLQFFDKTNKYFQGPASQNRILNGIKAGLIDGVIVASRQSIDVVSTLNSTVPTVVINDSFGEIGGVSCVTCDYWKAGFIAAEHLIRQGHRRIGYITRGAGYVEDGHNLSGFRTACEVYGVEFSPNNILCTGKGSEVFKKRVKDFFKTTKASGFFVRYDLPAARIIQILLAMDYRIPEDISFIGAGNYSSGYVCDIPLTTVDTHFGSMCEKAVELLVDKINGNPKTSLCDTVLIQPKLIKRNSVNKINTKQTILVPQKEICMK